MRDPASYLDDVGQVVGDLTRLGLQPVLVGGMAMVTIGSRRVTRDFDFVIAHPAERLQALVDQLYDRGLELASRLNHDGEVTATIDNRRVAGIRLRLDAPLTACFYNPRSGLRIDLLFDFPIPATRLRAVLLRVASEADLLRLKKIARTSRSSSGDAEDIAFLEARRKAP